MVSESLQKLVDQVTELTRPGADGSLPRLRPPVERYGTFIFECDPPMIEYESPKGPFSSTSGFPSGIAEAIASMRQFPRVKHRWTHIIASEGPDGPQLLKFDAHAVGPDFLTRPHS